MRAGVARTIGCAEQQVRRYVWSAGGQRGRRLADWRSDCGAMELLRCLEVEARQRLSQAHFDFFAGGAGDEQTLSDNAVAWRKLWLRPRAMVDVGRVDTTSAVLGDHLALPVLLAPMSTQRLLHRDGEVACARAARRGWQLVLSGDARDRGSR